MPFFSQLHENRVKNWNKRRFMYISGAVKSHVVVMLIGHITHQFRLNAEKKAHCMQK